MNESDIFKITEEPKPLPDNYEPGDFLVNLVRLVREGDQAQERLKTEVRELNSANDTLLIQLADYLFMHQRMIEKFRANHADAAKSGMLDQFAALSNKIFAALRNAGVSIDDPLGKKLEGELLGCVAIHGWLPTDAPDERVHETLEAIVRRNGKVIRLGRVVGVSQHASVKPSGGTTNDH